MSLSHDERRARRMIIAEYAGMHGIYNAAHEFNVTDRTVRTAVREFGIQIPRHINVSIYKIIALLLEDKSDADISKEIGISHGWIRTVRRKCIEAGVKGVISDNR